MGGKFYAQKASNTPERIEFSLLSPAERAKLGEATSHLLSTKNTSQIIDFLDELKRDARENPKFINHYAIAIIEALKLDDPSLTDELVEKMNSFIKRIDDSYYIPQFVDHLKSFALIDDNQISHRALVALTNAFYVVDEHLRPDILATMRLEFRNAQASEKEKVADHLFEILKSESIIGVVFSQETQDQLLGFTLDALGDLNHFTKRKAANILGSLAISCPQHLDTILVVSQNIMNDKSERGKNVQDHFAKAIAGLSIAINGLRPEYDAHSTEIRIDALRHIISNLVNHETDFARKKAVFKLDTVYENIPELRDEIDETLRRLEKDPSVYVRQAVSETQSNIANFKAGITPDHGRSIEPLGFKDR